MALETYLELGTNIKEIQRIESFKITQSFNNHAHLFLTAIVSEQDRDGCVKQVNALDQIEVFVEGEAHKTLFRGVVENVQVRAVRGIFYLEIQGVSNSFKTDIKKQYRSFQDKNMTYTKMIESIISCYDGGSIIDKASDGKTIDRFILQYRETDWEFLVRMASHFNMGVLPMITLEGIKLIFGTFEGKEIGKIEEYNYYISKNIAKYMKSSQNTNPGLSELDAVEFMIETVNDYQIGDKVTYQGVSLYIKSKEMEMSNGAILYRYSLSTKEGMGQDKIYNEQIRGISLKGRILQAIKDKVKVHLEVDQSQDVGKAWEFPYTSMYTAEGNSGWYCMPEVNDTVLIYFPSREEHAAMGMNSIRVLGKASDKTGNPDVKYFRTIDGKELKFSPEEILITCVSGNGKNIYLRLNQDSGIEIVSTEPIAFKSDKGISLNAKETIKILSEEQIRLKCKTSEIVIDSKVDICGEEVKIN